MSGTRTGRRWPVGLEDEIFIKRPHAVAQFKERAGYEPDYNFDKAEEELRRAVIEQMTEAKMLRNKSGKSNEFVVRVAMPGREVVYALVEEGASGGNYRYLIHTVYTKEMYDSWNEEGKLGTLGDLPFADALKDVKPMAKKPEKQETNGASKLLIRWQDSDGRYDSKWTTKEEVNTDIFGLLASGVKLNTIEVFRKVDFELSIKIGD